MSRRLVVSPQADRDIDAASVFIDQDSPEAALRFLDAVRDTLADIAAMPGMGSAQAFQNPRLQGIRRWQIRGFPAYLVFYHATDDTIEIVRILHGARNIPSILEEEGQ